MIYAFYPGYRLVYLPAVPGNYLRSVMYAELGNIRRLIVDRILAIFDQNSDHPAVIEPHHGNAVIVSRKMDGDVVIDIFIMKLYINMRIVKSVGHFRNHFRVGCLVFILFRFLDPWEIILKKLIVIDLLPAVKAILLFQRLKHFFEALGVAHPREIMNILTGEIKYAYNA